MKRRLLSGIAALPLLLIQPTRSDALIVACANCSTIAQQLLDAATQAKQLATQALQYTTQLDQYKNQIINTTALPMSIWSQVQNDINQVRNLANAASLLTGNSGLILSRLQQGYASQVLPQNAGQEFAMWSQTMGNASNSLGRTLAVQQQQQIGYAGQQQQIALQSQTAVGQLAAIQATNETLGLISTELNQAQTTLVAASQEVATRDAIAAERQGIADAYTAQFLAAAPFSTTGYPRY